MATYKVKIDEEKDTYGRIAELVEIEANDDVVKEGYLFQFSDTLQIWESRYLILNSETLLVYASEPKIIIPGSSVPETTCPMEIQAISRGTNDVAGGDSASIPIYYLNFEDSTSKAKFCFGSLDDESRNCWMSTILTVVAQNLLLKKEKELAEERKKELAEERKKIAAFLPDGSEKILERKTSQRKKSVATFGHGDTNEKRIERKKSVVHRTDSNEKKGESGKKIVENNGDTSEKSRK